MRTIVLVHTSVIPSAGALGRGSWSTWAAHAHVGARSGNLKLCPGENL